MQNMRLRFDEFRRGVYAVVMAVPCGKVITYGQVAQLAGYPRHARMVGRVLRDVPASSGLPCHRVVNSVGRTAPHWEEQRNLLEAEGVVFRSNGCVNMGICRWNFTDE